LCERRNPALGHEDGASIVGPGLLPLPALQLRGGGLRGTFDPTQNKEITIGEGWLYQIEQVLTERRAARWRTERPPTSSVLGGTADRAGLKNLNKTISGVSA
jgi:hypothetical protein